MVTEITVYLVASLDGLLCCRDVLWQQDLRVLQPYADVRKACDVKGW